VAALFTSPALAVRRVRVLGLSGLTAWEARETQARAAIPPHTNVLRVRVDEIAAALKRLPWVADAVVWRRLPDGLEARLTPRVPAALLTTPGGRWEIDGAGIPIRPARTAKGLPIIEMMADWKVRHGVPIAAPGVAEALFIARESVGEKPFRMAKIEVDQNADMCLNMQDNIAIRLGQADDLAAKLALVRRIYAEAPDIGTEVQVIDLRCPEAPVCIPRPPGKAAPRSAASPPGQLHDDKRQR